MSDALTLGGGLALGTLLVGIIGLVIGQVRAGYQTFATKGELNQVWGQQTVENENIRGMIREVKDDLVGRLERIEDLVRNGRK